LREDNFFEATMNSIRKAISLAGMILLIIIMASTAGAGTLEQADRLLVDPQVDKVKALQAFTMYESLLPAAGAQRLPVLERLSRAAFVLGDIAEKGQRRLYYEQGRQYAQTILQEYPQRVEGHYWLGLNLAGLADVSRMQGMRLLPQILEALEHSAAIDPTYDQAGAYRVLGRIYYEAPGRPISVGDINKSLDLLKKAMNLAPTNSTNHLYLAETFIKLGQLDQAKQELQQVLAATQNADGPRGLAADHLKAKELLNKKEL
jgi:tetratricopeptide (TPR) repeat protein